MSVPGSLPQGWDSKFDPRTGKYYYINHYTKTTSWEDPRQRLQTISDRASSLSGVGSKENKPPPNIKPEEIALQDFSSCLTNVVVGPASSLSLSKARSTSVSGQISGLTGAPTNKSLAALHLDESISGMYVGTPSPQNQTASSLFAGRRDSQLSNIAEAETSFIEYDLPVSQVAEMFPTVDKSHIRDLLKRFCFSVDMVISHLDALKIAQQQNSPETTSKLEYLKSVFPTVEEYLLLDVLSNSDNNVSSGSDRLVKMGYVKRDTPNAPRLQARKKEEERLAEKRTPLPKQSKKSVDESEKSLLRAKMCEQYEVENNIPQRILFMALESALYDEDQAVSLIQSMIEDDLKRNKAKEVEKLREKERRKSPKLVRKALTDVLPTPSSPKREAASTKDVVGGAHGKVWNKASARTTTEQVSKVPPVGSNRAKGPNPALRKGPNDDLLLSDYIAWNGPNPSLCKGPNPSNVRGPSLTRGTGSFSKGGMCHTLAVGPNPSLVKGPSSGLAKGSMYYQHLVSAL